jgi:hypothetical protein
VKEAEAQSAICEYLRLRRVFFVRLNNIPSSYIDHTGAKRFRKMGKYARLGLADILTVKDGKAIFLEVKSETGRPSKDQLDFGRDPPAQGVKFARRITKWPY